MTVNARLLLVLGCAWLLIAGCSSQPDPAAPSPDKPAAIMDETAEEPPPTEPAEEPAAAEAAEPPPTLPVEQPPEETAPPAQVEEPSTPPEPKPAEEPAPAEPEGWAVIDLGGPVEVGATRADLTRIGAGKCKICHKVQYASWAEGPHGTRTPPLDCEDCHGPGSAYKSKKVMEDPEQARAAGMVIPDRAFCEQCHKGGLTDDLLTQAHAHKEEDGS